MLTWKRAGGAIYMLKTYIFPWSPSSQQKKHHTSVNDLGCVLQHHVLVSAVKDTRDLIGKKLIHTLNYMGFLIFLNGKIHKHILKYINTVISSTPL